MLYAVALLLDVGAVEEGVGLVAAGLAQEVGVDFCTTGFSWLRR